LCCSDGNLESCIHLRPRYAIFLVALLNVPGNLDCEHFALNSRLVQDTRQKGDRLERLERLERITTLFLKQGFCAAKSRIRVDWWLMGQWQGPPGARAVDDSQSSQCLNTKTS
jgi:hypothetical protein